MSRFIDEHCGRFGVEPICRTLGVLASAYYQRASGHRSRRAVEDGWLLEQIEAVHEANYHAYGYRRTWLALGRRGAQVGRDRVKRLMRAHGIQGAKRRGKPWRTTRPDPAARRPPDRVCRDFTAAGPDRLWVADFTHVRCWEGVTYFAFVIDVYSRRIVGWQLAGRMRTDLVLDALRMALARGQAGADVELVHHSDAGSQGGFKWSSQHLEREELRWAGRFRLGSVRGGRRCGSPGRPPVGRREHRQRFWTAIARGRSSEDAAAEAGVSVAVGVRWFREGGGMPTVPLAAPSGRYLSFAEREEIAIGRACGAGVKEIARRIGRSPSTVSRELCRNAATRGGRLEYRATTAQWHADRRARPKPAKVPSTASCGAMCRTAWPVLSSARTGPRRRQDRRWARAWSPEQISHRPRLDFPDDPSMRVSHEPIYQSLFVQGRGALRRELTACLRSGRTLRVPRARTQRGKGFVSDEVMISQRRPRRPTGPSPATGRAT